MLGARFFARPDPKALYPYPEPPTPATLPLQRLTGTLPSLGSGEISNQHILDTNPQPTPLPPPQDWRAAVGLMVPVLQVQQDRWSRDALQ